MVSVSKGLGLILRRNLNSAGAAVSTSLERLSSGQRINRPSDDAAGRAISDSLNVRSRVYSQGLRNLNDGVSLLNIADNALSALGDITSRLQELAAQSSNGSLGITQRRALNEEGDALTQEFNRIVDSTRYNGLTLLNGSVNNLRLQGGFGKDGGVAFGITQELSRTVGTGGFTSTISTTLLASRRILEADLNNDGNLDLLAGHAGGYEVRLGNGSGGFSVSNGLSTTFAEFTLGDIDGDGDIDLLKGGANQGTYYRNNGSGILDAGTTIALSTGSISGVAVADINNDGIPDIIGANSTLGAITVRTGAGSGTFNAAQSYGGATSGGRLTLADVNDDGLTDILSVSSSGVNVFTGEAGGAFNFEAYYVTGAGASEAQTADFNFDGTIDIAVYNAAPGTVSILSGNGDGSFEQSGTLATLTTGAFGALRSADFNSDGITDLLVGSALSGSVPIYRGNGDGTFSPLATLAITGPSGGVSVGDFNNDGIADAGAAAYGSQFVISINGTTRSSGIEKINLADRDGALQALDSLEDTAQRISLERASVGSAQSRISAAYGSYAASRGATEEAAARITQVDTAGEVALLLKNQILQSTGTALLAQANQSSKIVLSLLSTNASVRK